MADYMPDSGGAIRAVNVGVVVLVPRQGKSNGVIKKREEGDEENKNDIYIISFNDI